MSDKITNGDMTNKGLVRMVDTPHKNEDGTDADVLVMTHNGAFRMSELEKIPKAEKPDFDLLPKTDFGSVVGVDIRPGTVQSAERVEKTDKLIHLKVKTNLGVKDVVTNLGEHFEPSNFLGKKFLFVVNMEPVKMRGILSEAMIMASTTMKFNPDENKYEEQIVLMEVNIPLDSVINK